MRRFKRFFLVLSLSSAWLHAGTIYQITDLGAMVDGGASAAAGISTNGFVTGSGDADAVLAAAYRWTPLLGISIVLVDSIFAFGAGINASGVVAGWEFANDLATYSAFVNDGAGTQYIPTLGGDNNAATGINDAGTIVGYSDTGTGTQVAFSYSSAEGVKSLGTPAGDPNSWAYAINSAGEIVGAAGDWSSTSPSLYINNGWVDLAMPSGYQSGEATAISDAGQVAGTLSDGTGGSVAFLWAGGATTLLYGLSAAYGVNSSGFVVGTSGTAALLYRDSTVYDLNTLLDPTASGWQLEQAMAINDSGLIAGTGTHDGVQRAFLLTPYDTAVPEPGVGFTVFGGLLSIAAFWRLRCRTFRTCPGAKS